MWACVSAIVDVNVSADVLNKDAWVGCGCLQQTACSFSVTGNIAGGCLSFPRPPHWSLITLWAPFHCTWIFASYKQMTDRLLGSMAPGESATSQRPCAVAICQFWMQINVSTFLLHSWIIINPCRSLSRRKWGKSVHMNQIFLFPNLSWCHIYFRNPVKKSFMIGVYL